MAIIRKGPNGDVSGRIGDKIYRVRNKKNFVCKRPASQKISQTTNSVKNRSRFANTIHLAKLIKSIPELYLCWKSAKIPGSNGYQRIIKHNSKNISESGLTLKNIITPPGFEITQDFITIEKSKLIISVLLDKPLPDLQFSLIALLCVKKEKESEHFILKTDNVSLQEGSALKGIISLTPDEMKKINLCNKALLLSSFLTFSPELLWSSTIPVEFRC